MIHNGIPASLELLAFFAPAETDEDWREQALCAQTDPESFFPDKGGSTREAKKVCAACSVREECLKAALDNDERFGIWGGLSERERRKLKPRRRNNVKAITPDDHAARAPGVETERAGGTAA